MVAQCLLGRDIVLVIDSRFARGLVDLSLVTRHSSLLLIYFAASLRSLGVGLTGVILGVYVARAGFSPAVIGVVISAGLAGSAVATLLVSLRADTLGRRFTMTGLSVVSAMGGLGFALTGSLAGIVLLAFVGMLNGMGTDRGPVFSIEQAMIPQMVTAERRTLALSWYAVVTETAQALGALAAGLPLALQHWFGFDLLRAYQVTFGLYAALNLASAVPYLLLSSAIELPASPLGAQPAKATISPQSKRVITKLAALSSVDSLGGGLMTDALIAFWFFQRFGVAEAKLGAVFFAGHVLNSLSYLVAAWLAKRIGLLNTMIFTHIPSSLFLMSMPLAPSSGWAIVLLLAREALVEMDLPTRQSYTVAVVQPNERTFASGISNLTRAVARSITPSFAGLLMQRVAMGTPLVVGSGMKILYDILLFAAFRRLKPPEERDETTGPAPA
ncbi:MAG: MFS transporter [Terriglobia bacterium]|jgi:MFS family permease